MEALGTIMRDCPLKGHSAPKEARGGGGNLKRSTHDVALLVANTDADSSARIEPEETGASKKPDDIEKAVTQMMATMHGITPRQTLPGGGLGPTPTCQVHLEGVPVKALLDTASPISIVSLEQFLKVAAENRAATQSPAEWGEAIRARLKPSTMSPCSCGEGELAIISQVCCRICQGSQEIDTTLQVQKEAPVDLLLGTDTLPKLGITLVQTEDTTGPIHLLQPTKRNLPTLSPDLRAPSLDPLGQGKEEKPAQEHRDSNITVRLFFFFFFFIVIVYAKAQDTQIARS